MSVNYTNDFNVIVRVDGCKTERDENTFIILYIYYFIEYT